MARYYDLDSLATLAKYKADTLIGEKAIAFYYVAKWLDLLPAADVVPRTEFDLLEKERDEYKKHVDEDIIYVHRIKSEVAREIFSEVDKIIDEIYNKHVLASNDLDDLEKEAVMNFSDDITYHIAELKKKYTEGS